MDKERQTDKRKAREKDTEDESGTDASTSKNPTKRLRVDNSPSKDVKSLVSATEQKSSPGKSSAATSTDTLATSSVPKAENNGDLSVTHGSGSGGNNVISKKFDLPTPYTPQELAQKFGGNSNGDVESESDDDSTKFLADIMKNQNKKGKTKSNGSPVPRSKRNGGSSKSNSDVMNPPEVKSVNNSEMPSGEVQVSLRITDPVTGQSILDEIVVKSDCQRINAFLRQHGIDISLSSQISSSSGYLGDTSAGDSSHGKNRWTISSSSSLGSTIPRQSIVSIVTDRSDSPDERPKLEKPSPKPRKKNEPLLTSTKISETVEEQSSAGRESSSNVGLSNGDSDSHLSKSPTKKVRGTPAPSQDEGIGTMTPTSSQMSTPTTGRKGGKASLTKNTPTPKGSASKSATRKRRVGSANNFPITNTITPPELSAVLNTPPPARSVAKVEGTTAKPLSQFELEMNNEKVGEVKLEISSTLFSTILPEEPVFARWRDRCYYSGVIKSKGMNDTWVIDFDDGMEDVASETHIIPVRILGTGIKGIYSPDETYKPREAVIIGHKLSTDKSSEEKESVSVSTVKKPSIVKYAIEFKDDNGQMTQIFCSRRQLVLKETEAKKLRSESQQLSGVKPGDVSLDNIVSGPRRRTKGGDSETPSTSGKTSTPSLDASVSEDKSKVDNSTPKSRGGKAKKTPASEPKRKRGGSTATPQTKDASTSSPIKEAPETPKVASDVGKKKTKRPLFQNMQFFLTAAGGGDPGISGPQTTLTPYDKDELRDQIETNGGVVLDQVGSNLETNVFLISDGYARTVKYIYSLARGIPCLSNRWIKQCLEANDIVDYSVFLLPAGWSLERQDLIPKHNRKPLKDFKIFVTSESDQLYNYWKPVLTAAEAILMKPPRKKGVIIPSGTEVVVTDNHSEATRHLLDEAEIMGLPVVKPEWLVQTIILGEKAHMYGHEKYKVVVEDEESEFNPDVIENESAEDQENVGLDNISSPD